MELLDRAEAEATRILALATPSAPDPEGVGWIRDEMAKLEASPPGEPDCAEVLRRAGELLAGARDLRVAGWYAVAGGRREGAAGALAGLVLVRRLMEQGSETLRPERPSARRAAIEYLLEKIGGQLGQGTASPELTAALAQQATEISRRSRDLGFEVATPTWSRTQVAPAARPVAVATVADPVGSLAQRARDLQARGPEDPRGYVLLRRVVWLEVPGEGSSGPVAGPEPAFAAQLGTQTLPEQKLQWAEHGLERYPLWLDLQRHAAEALDALDRGAASGAILRETRALLVRSPWVARGTFADGRPFASEATQAWLAEPAPNAGGQSSRIDAVLQSAVDALRSGAKERALQQLVPLLALAHVPASEWDPASFRRLLSLLLEASTDRPELEALRREWTQRRDALDGLLQLARSADV